MSMFGKVASAGMPRSAALRAALDGQIDGQALDARHCGEGLAPISAPAPERSARSGHRP
jgi:hypothetical protein